MVRFFILASLMAALLRADDWTEFRYGPFEVQSSTGERQAKEALNFLEQLRYALGSQLGQPELESTWPIRVVLTGKSAAVYPQLRLARDAWICSVPAIGPATVASIAETLLDSWTGALPPHLKRGLISLYSTLEVQGTRVTLGTPPSQKDRDWSRAHMLAVHPEYSGKLRVLLANLGKGVEPDVAYRNAFSMTGQEVERALDKYIEADQYGTIPAPSRAISVRQFLGKPLDDFAGQLTTADVLLAHNPPAAAAAYQAILKLKPGAMEAQEGLGLIAAAAGDKVAAKTYLANAQSARSLLEYARVIDDVPAKEGALKKSAQANPRWAEPYKQLAAIAMHPAQKLAALRKAAQLESQNSSNWVALAQMQESANQMVDAAKSWAAAEHAAADPNDRERIRQYRIAGQQKRDAAVLAAREDARRKAEREMEDLRNRALMDIRRAEAKANAGRPVIDASQLDEYKEGPSAATVQGVLQRVDCRGPIARLHIAAGKQVTRLLVMDPSKVALAGGGERSLGCGVQKPARNVRVEYTPRKDTSQGTVGDAVTIEFH